MSTAATVVSFEPSAFVPLALGFFGLGTGYLIALGLLHIAVGLWLMWLTVAVVLNTARGFHLPV